MWHMETYQLFGCIWIWLIRSKKDQVSAAQCSPKIILTSMRSRDFCFFISRLGSGFRSSNRERVVRRDVELHERFNYPLWFIEGWKAVWASPLLFSSRLGCSTSAEWNHSLMQGMVGCSDSTEHGVILAEVPNTLEDLLGSSIANRFQGLTCIDDVILELLSLEP